MEKEDDFTTFNGYDLLLSRLEDARKKQQVVFIYLYEEGHYHDIIRDWLLSGEGLNTKFKNAFGAALKLMHISTVMKEIPKIFDVYSFPSFLLLDHNLEVFDKFRLQDYMGGNEKLLYVSTEVLGGRHPDPPFSQFEKRLEDGINNALQKTVPANPKPCILTRLEKVISDRNVWTEKWPKRAYESLLKDH